MSSPSFENMDQWFFEFIEGNLSPAQEEKFLDFLQENPELILEFKTWKLAKARHVNEEMDYQTLLKPNPFLSTPVLISSIATTVLLLLIGVWWWNLNPEPQYSLATSTDLNIVSVQEIDKRTMKSDEAQFIRAENFNNQTNISTSTESTLEMNNSNSLALISTRNFDQPITNNKELQETHIDKIVNADNTEFLDAITTIQENDFNEDAYNESFAVIEKQLSAKSEGLDEVIDFLAGNSKPFDIELDELSANYQGTKTSTVDVAKAKNVVTKSSSRNLFAVTMQKIKRMIDQPTALRNVRDPHYHAPMMTAFAPNGGMVGGTYGNRIQMTSRSQWTNKESSQLMNTLSWDGYLYALRGGIGVDLNFDTYNQGVINNYYVGLTYSPKFSINKDISFEPALRFKMGMIDLNNPDNLFGKEFEFNRGNVIPFFNSSMDLTGEKLWYRDVGLGFMLNTKSFYIGFNADNLNRHDNNFYSSDLSKEYKESIFYTAVIGTEYQSITRNLSVNGYALFQSYGDLSELWAGANIQYKWFQFGAGINTRADFGGSIGVNINKLTIYYNIDYINSKLLDRKDLSHQISMKLMLKPNRQNIKFLTF